MMGEMCKNVGCAFGDVTIFFVNLFMILFSFLMSGLENEMA